MGPDKIALQGPAEWSDDHEVVIGHRAQPRPQPVVDLAIYRQVNGAGIHSVKPCRSSQPNDNPTNGFTAIWLARGRPRNPAARRSRRLGISVRGSDNGGRKARYSQSGIGDHDLRFALIEEYVPPPRRR